MRLPVSAAAKATIFGQEQAQMRAAVERQSDRENRVPARPAKHTLAPEKAKKKEEETANEPIFPPPPQRSHDNFGVAAG